jgi:hypothetical protein
VGVNVWDPRCLRFAIEEALSDPSEQRQAREDALDLVYANRHGGASAAAAGALTDWLGSQAVGRAA